MEAIYFESAADLRFTPRNPRSNWSVINTKRAAQLVEEGRMTPAGMRAYESRDRTRSGTYSYEGRFQPFKPPRRRRPTGAASRRRGRRRAGPNTLGARIR